MSALTKWKNQAAAERSKRNALSRKHKKGQVPGAVKSGLTSAVSAGAVSFMVTKSGQSQVMGFDSRVAVGLLGLGAGVALRSPTAIDAAFGPLIAYADRLAETKANGS